MKMQNCAFSTFILIIFQFWLSATEEAKFLDDVCGPINGKRVYLHFGETGTLQAKYNNNVFEEVSRDKSKQKLCSVEFVSCPSCVINITFKNCGRPSVFDSCGCDYVWIYEPNFQQSSQQFCGRYIFGNFSHLQYKSKTRKVVVEFLYHKKYEHAFTFDYVTERNKVTLTGQPTFGKMDNVTQIITTPFFPSPYPSDLTMEHVIRCETKNESCRISLVFTDFLIASSTIIDFFDWNSDRLYVTTGSIFRPAVIITSGPSLLIRFYANGASDFGFKAYYSFILGQSTGSQLAPVIDCGGQINNLGGGITMMNMLEEGLKAYDCVWLIKPPETYHRKTHLYVKIANFSAFADNTELTIRQGLTSEGPLLQRVTFLSLYKAEDNIATISQGFYIRLKGIFRPESNLALVYAAFNYKDCLAGSDFLCHNKRCISALLKCDGFDHCGDNSDEITCSKDPHDRREWSKTPHFLFTKDDALSDVATSTVIFLLCRLIGFIFAMVVLLYKVNIKTRHRRQIQDHIETINAILEEGIGVVEEEIIIPDDPPDYEPPPEYEQVVKRMSVLIVQGTSRSCQTSPRKIPDSPPPAYTFSANRKTGILNKFSAKTNKLCENLSLICRRRYKTRFLSDSELDQLYDSVDDLRAKKWATIEDVHL